MGALRYLAPPSAVMRVDRLAQKAIGFMPAVDQFRAREEVEKL